MSDRMPTGLPDDLKALFKRFEPLHERIERNRRRLTLFFGAYATLTSFLVAVAVVTGAYLALLLVAFRIGGEYLVGALFWFTINGPFIVLGIWALCLPAFIIWSIRTLRRGETSLLQDLRAVPVAIGEYPIAKAALHDVAIASGMPLPRLAVIRDDAVNAFVISHHSDAGWIGVTSGLLDRLSKDELRFVFAHLIARIEDGSARTATILAELFATAADAAARSDRLLDIGSDRVDDTFVQTVMRIVLAPISSWYGLTRGCLGMTKFIVLSGYRKQQMLNAECADSMGMMLTKDPASMMSALNKVLPADNRPGTIYEPRFRKDVFGALFFAWPVFSYADDEELVRITRMREVLGPASI